MHSPNTNSGHYIETGQIEEVKYTQGHAITSGQTQGNDIIVDQDEEVTSELHDEDKEPHTYQNGIDSPNTAYGIQQSGFD